MYSTVMILALTALGNPTPETSTPDATSPHGLSMGIGVGARMSFYFPQHTSSRDHRIELSSLDKMPSGEVSLDYRYQLEKNTLRLGVKFGYGAFTETTDTFEHTYTGMPLLGTFEWTGGLAEAEWDILLGIGIGKIWNQSNLEAGDGFISESGNLNGLVSQLNAGVVFPQSAALDIGVEYHFQSEYRVKSHLIVLTTDYLILGGN